MQLECAYVNHPELERKNDKFLMNAACVKSKAELSDADIRTINSCWCYLEVQRMSDICTTDGRYMLQSVTERQRSGS